MPKILVYILIAVFTLSVQAKNISKNSKRIPSNQALQGLFNNGDYAPQIDFINSAQESIDIEIYEMFDPDFQKALVDAVTNRNIKVRIIKEPRPVGDQCNTFDFAQKKKKKDHQKPDSCKKEKELMDLVVSKNGVFVPFKKKELCGRQVPPMNDQCVQHGKMIIIDKKAVLISTGNFNSSSLCSGKTEKCNRDYSYITTQTDEVKNLVDIFEKDLKAERYDPTTDLNKNLTISPFSHEPLMDFIKSATTKVQIQNQYLKDPQLNSAIKAAAKNAKVQVQVASFTAFSPNIKPGVRKNLCCILTDFEKAHVEVKVFTPEQEIKNKKGYLHSKAIVVDGKKAWIGSVNGSTQSLLYNREFGIFFDDPENVGKLEKIMNDDFNHVKALDWKKQLDCTDIDFTSQCSQATNKTPTNNDDGEDIN